MRVRGLAMGFAATLALTSASYAAQPGTSEGRMSTPSHRASLARPVAGTTCPVFPADNYWNTDIRGLPVAARSRQWLSHMSTSVDLHPDFGPSFGAGPDYGIPITVVGHGHPRVRVRFTYASESDHVRYPLG
jgi:hypothetical protein